MPKLDWLNREAAFRTAEQVPARALRPHGAGQVGRVRAEHSAGRCAFAMLFKLETGLNVTPQVDAALP